MKVDQRVHVWMYRRPCDEQRSGLPSVLAKTIAKVEKKQEMLDDSHVTVLKLCEQISEVTKMYIIRKTLKGRKQTNKYGRGTERHLPKTDESVVRPAGECR